jgi:hypothetical protein
MPILRIFLVIAIVLLLSPGACPTAEIVSLTPHRAVYALNLISARDNTNIAAVSGRAVTEWSGSHCDGYVQSQRIFTVIEDMEGPVRNSDIRLNSYEAADGSSYSFSLDYFYNGVRVENFRGEAHREDDTAAGEIQLVQPRKTVIVMPEGTLFPTQLILKLATLARQGRRENFQGPSFDSSDFEKILQLSAVIGRAKLLLPPERKIEGKEIIQNMRAAPVAVSYFDEGRRDGLPEYELSFPLYENGVAGDMRIDYGEFVISAELIYLKELPKNDCGI